MFSFTNLFRFRLDFLRLPPVSFRFPLPAVFFPFALPDSFSRRYPQSVITVKVVSMIDIPQDRQDSIGRWLQAVSPVTETALYNYDLKADLFDWRDLTAGSNN